MRGTVHYLVRNPSTTSGLVYPGELHEDYVGFGAFYILGDEPPLRDTYQFLAVHGERLIRPNLVRFRESRSFYRVRIRRVGTFTFFAQPLPSGLSYDGNEGARIRATRRLRAWHPEHLEAAARNDLFYFVGYAGGAS